MTTARDTVQGALELLRVLDIEDGDMQAYQAEKGLKQFNDMMHGFVGAGADVGWADLALTDELPLPREHHEHVRYVLAVRLAPGYSALLTPEVAKQAQDSLKILQAAYRRVGTLRPDRALQNRLSRYSSGWNIKNG
ncbi:hypothetical protein [Denitrobaculum tricleocarpae]|uniref:Uncharacterized protein n=1 Tax=Denitrobaculum tricleocarpae TaxID=2591009 RepID=A0A545TSX7_9PROT|nr:hypothetical protein [Denitrobaculum tricleocarpae]TQV80320.1 hypothetical protein FKG95_08990 [Denitrobaculum tricleocarpae]